MQRLADGAGMVVEFLDHPFDAFAEADFVEVHGEDVLAGTR